MPKILIISLVLLIVLLMLLMAVPASAKNVLDTSSQCSLTLYERLNILAQMQKACMSQDASGTTRNQTKWCWEATKEQMTEIENKYGCKS